MNEEQLKGLFERARSRSGRSSEEAKRQAIDLALNEFDVAGEKKPHFFQVFTARFRLTGNSKQPEDEKMKKSNPFWQWSGVSTVAVAAFVVVFLNVRPGNVPVESPNERDKEVGSRLEQPSQLSTSKSEIDEVAAVGFRESIEQSNEARPEGEVSSIFAEDIGSGSKPHIAEALSRVTGVSVNKGMQGGVAKFSSHGERKIRAEPLPERERTQHQHRDEFEHKDSNPIVLTRDVPVSTFSIDVDTASYSYVRRQLNHGRLPEKDAVRIEEILNYFDYDYPLADDRKQPFKPSVSVMDSPFSKDKKLMHIGIKGYELPKTKQPKSNLVLLLDVSGSMNSADKLPLVKQSMGLLLDQLHDDDTVAIVVYAGAAGTVLEPTKVKKKSKILAALSALNAGGSTAGAQGIELAYQLAELNFNQNAVNRIILATDGDFNVGINDRKRLQDYIERKRDKGIYLSVLGFGQGNYQDHLMQTFAQNGNGIAAYIDTLSEAQKVLVNEATSSLFPIANDVKIQVEFNPDTVAEYRLLGYETRALKREDFNNDKVDAGDIGAGHTVTAIYEITPVSSRVRAVDTLRYAQPSHTSKKDGKTRSASTDEYAFVKIRYKLPGEPTSKRIEKPVPARNTSAGASKKYNNEVAFSVAVAGFAQLLKDDTQLQSWSYGDALALAQKHKGEDLYGYRTEFVQLIRKAMIAKP